MIGRMTESLSLLHEPTCADAELEAPVRKNIDRCGLLCQRDRIGDDQGHDRDTQAHTLGRGRDEAKRDHRVGPRGLRVPRREAVLAVWIPWLERGGHDGVRVRPHGIESKSLRGPRHPEHRFAARPDVGRQHHAEAHGAEFRESSGWVVRSANGCSAAHHEDHKQDRGADREDAKQQHREDERPVTCAEIDRAFLHIRPRSLPMSEDGRATAVARTDERVGPAERVLMRAASTQRS